MSLAVERHIKWINNDKEGKKLVYRELAPEEQKELEIFDFSKLDLRHADFSGWCPVDVKFKKCNLSFCNFNNCSLHWVSFKGSKLSNATFIGSNLFRADLTGCNIEYAFFLDAILPEDTIEKTENIDNAYFSYYKTLDIIKGYTRLGVDDEDEEDDEEWVGDKVD